MWVGGGGIDAHQPQPSRVSAPQRFHPPPATALVVFVIAFSSPFRHTCHMSPQPRYCSGLDDAACVASLRSALLSISDDSRLVAYENACSEDTMNFQHMDK